MLLVLALVFSALLSSPSHQLSSALPFRFTQDGLGFSSPQAYPNSNSNPGRTCGPLRCGESVNMSGYLNWPAGFSKGVGAVAGTVFDGTYIWLVPYNADRVVRIHGIFDGTHVWLVPYSANQVLRIDPSAGNMTGYNAWPG
jgi:hypothetical protein